MRARVNQIQSENRDLYAFVYCNCDLFFLYICWLCRRCSTDLLLNSVHFGRKKRRRWKYRKETSEIFGGINECNVEYIWMHNESPHIQKNRRKNTNKQSKNNSAMQYTIQWEKKLIVYV